MPVALIPAAAGVVGGLKRLTKAPCHSSGRDPKDAADLLQKALAGDPVALQQLQIRSKGAATARCRQIFQSALNKAQSAGVIMAQMAAPTPAPLPLPAAAPPGAEPPPPPADSSKGNKFGFLLIAVVLFLLWKGSKH